MSRTVPLSIIRGFSLYTAMVYVIHHCCVQWKPPDDGQRNYTKHVEFYSKNKFEKVGHLVGFIIRSYHDVRPHERQMPYLNSNPITVWRYGSSDHGVGLIQLTAGARELSFFQSFQTGYEAHRASKPVGTGGSFPGVKRTEREAIAEVKNVCSYTYTPTVHPCRLQSQLWLYAVKLLRSGQRFSEEFSLSPASTVTPGSRHSPQQLLAFLCYTIYGTSAKLV